jgi:hypothetical protein
VSSCPRPSDTAAYVVGHQGATRIPFRLINARQSRWSSNGRMHGGAIPLRQGKGPDRLMPIGPDRSVIDGRV